jgi:hypothetical protein
MRPSFHADALAWLTHVRNQQHIGATDGSAGSLDADSTSMLLRPTANRWLMPVVRETAAAPAADDERTAETAELLRERERRRAVPLKTLLLRHAPAARPPATVSSQSFGFDAIDSRFFASHVAQLHTRRATALAQARSALSAVADAPGTSAATLGRTSAANPSAAGASGVSSGSFGSGAAGAPAGGASQRMRLGDDGACVAQSLKTLAEVDFLVHQLKQPQTVAVTSLDVSGSAAVQTYDESEGPLMRKVTPLVFFREELPWLRVVVLVADGAKLHDYDADFLGRALREPACALEKLSLRSNLITEDGADRLKKAVKYNARIMHIELAGNPCTQKPTERGRVILAHLDERLAANRRKKLFGGGK